MRRELGGLEVYLVTVLIVLEALVRIDASTSWTLGLPMPGWLGLHRGTARCALEGVGAPPRADARRRAGKLHHRPEQRNLSSPQASSEWRSALPGAHWMKSTPRPWRRGAAIRPLRCR